MTRGTVFRVLVRSLLLQAAWNLDRMQNLGVAYALEPGLEALYPAPEARERALRRHLEVFNTHPYMASVVMGVVLHLEERLGEQGAELERQLRSLRLGLLGSYGAVGDGLFWAALRPLALMMGAVASVLWPPWVVVVLVLGIFNAGHVLARVGGFLLGYQEGVGAISRVKELNLPRWTRRIRLVTVGLAGVWAGLLVARQDWILPGLDRATGLVVGPVLVFGAWRYLRGGRSVTSLVYWMVGLAVVITAGWVGLSGGWPR